MHIIKILLTLFVTNLFISNAYAISKDNHLYVTAKAVGAYEQCIKSLGIKNTLADGANTIIEMTKAEDATHLLRRYRNWHFFDAYANKEDKMKNRWFGARSSLHRIFKEHATELEKNIGRNIINYNIQHVYEYTGSLIHYVQDMAVPSHVSPIFHYNFIWDHSDYFDDKTEWKTLAYTPPAGLCSTTELSKDDGIVKQLEAVLTEAAHKTRSRIVLSIRNTNNSELKGKTWEAFWELRKPINDPGYEKRGAKPGFSLYGEKQGEDGFEKLCKNEPGVCLDFFQQSHNDAVTYAVKALLLINANHLKKRAAINHESRTE